MACGSKGFFDRLERLYIRDSFIWISSHEVTYKLGSNPSEREGFSTLPLPNDAYVQCRGFLLCLKGKRKVRHHKNEACASYVPLLRTETTVRHNALGIYASTIDNSCDRIWSIGGSRRVGPHHNGKEIDRACEESRYNITGMHFLFTKKDLSIGVNHTQVGKELAVLNTFAEREWKKTSWWRSRLCADLWLIAPNGNPSSQPKRKPPALHRRMCRNKVAKLFDLFKKICVNQFFFPICK